MELTHNEALEFSGISKDKLPADIQSKMSDLDGMIKQYESDNTNADLLNKIELSSAKLAHDITDFAEKDLPDMDNSVNVIDAGTTYGSTENPLNKPEDSEKSKNFIDHIFDFIGF